MDDTPGVKDDADFTNLINVALQKDKTKKEDRFLIQVRNFIKSKNIVPGDIRIPLYAIYKTYCECVDYPLGVPKFNRIFSQFFQRKMFLCNNYYNLTLEPFDLPYDYELLIDIKLRREKNVKNKSKKSKAT